VALVDLERPIYLAETPPGEPIPGDTDARSMGVEAVGALADRPDEREERAVMRPVTAEEAERWTRLAEEYGHLDEEGNVAIGRFRVIESDYPSSLTIGVVTPIVAGEYTEDCSQWCFLSSYQRTLARFSENRAERHRHHRPQIAATQID
jgi:hypothetical protein